MIRALLLAIALIPAAYAQASIPRTADGHPDFSGAWTSSFNTPLERIPGATSLAVSETEARALGERLYQQLLARENGLDPDVLAGNVRTLLRVGDEFRTSVVIDPPTGKIPYTAEGERLAAAARSRIPQLPDGPEYRPYGERCIAGHGQAPMSLTPTINSRQFIQTRDHLAIYTEDGPDLRIFDFANHPRPSAIVQWGGASIVHWEGDELVIETINQRPSVRGGAQGIFLMTAQTRVTERLRYIARDQLLYRYTVADPSNYAAPWSGEYVLTHSPILAAEYGCHEGNYAMVNMLRSARAADRRTGAKR